MGIGFIGDGKGMANFQTLVSGKRDEHKRFGKGGRMNWAELKENLVKSEYHYFHTDNGVLLCGDCLEVMKEIPDECVNLVLTDPPYGIGVDKMGYVKGGGKRSGRGSARKTVFKSYNDVLLTKDYFDLMLKVGKNQIIWGGNYYIDYLHSTRCILVWYKRDRLPIRSFADCEIAWTSFDKSSMVFNCRWDGFIRDSREKRTEHPTQKALEVFKWCVTEFSNECDLILDPFLGSGTTAVACEKLNRKWIGIEINPDYCEITKERILEGR